MVRKDEARNTHVVKFLGEGNNIWCQSQFVFLGPATPPKLLSENRSEGDQRILKHTCKYVQVHHTIG